MKAWSVIGLLFAAAIFATIPISPQVTPRGVELRVGHAQADFGGRFDPAEWRTAAEQSDHWKRTLACPRTVSGQADCCAAR
jgi:hypothetical protein